MSKATVCSGTHTTRSPGVLAAIRPLISILPLRTTLACGEPPPDPGDGGPFGEETGPGCEIGYEAGGLSGRIMGYGESNSGSGEDDALSLSSFSIASS